MEIETIQKMNGYFELYEKILGEVEDKDVALIVLQEMGKDKRCDRLKEARNQNLMQYATAKQIAFLKSFGVNAPEKITKKEASALIEQAKMQQVQAR